MMDCTTYQPFKFNGTTLMVHFTQREAVVAAVAATGMYVTWEPLTSSLRVSTGAPTTDWQERDFEDAAMWNLHAASEEDANHITAALANY